MPDLSTTAERSTVSGAHLDYEAIVIGAGVCGIYVTYRLQQLGVRFTTLETGANVGGTWYWNRYPGARFDSESVSYAYSFSKELLQEWNWSEHFSGQPETERYLQYVATRFDLRQHMQFNCTVRSARYDEATRSWAVNLSDGRTLTTRFLMTAIGVLSAPTPPRYRDMEAFKGLSFHTFNWPKEPIDYAGKKVAVIGTGATGVQIISDIASKVGELTVFQRRPNWCAPLRNRPIRPEEMAEIKATYDDIFERCRNTPSGFIHASDPRATFEVSKEERLAQWERIYNSPGFAKWLGNFKDALLDERANAEYTAFMADKIRQRVKNPEIAEKLIPKDHNFGTRRVPLETNYYEQYNRDNVHLVDISETPIERITETGIRTSERDFEFDIIVYATGFDAITGAFDRIDFVGANGQRLKDKWADGPVTTLGVMVTDFPNLITLAGPQSGSVATNFPRGIEEVVNWVTGLFTYLRANGFTRIEPKPEFEAEWIEHVKKMADAVLLGKEKSWFTGYNTNIDREYKRRYLIYMGGAQRYRARLQNQVETEYSGFDIS